MLGFGIINKDDELVIERHVYMYLISSVVREMRQLGSLRRQRIILRLANALHVVVMDSWLAIRVEKMATTSNLEGSRSRL